MKTCEALYSEMLASYSEKTGFVMADSADLAVRLYAAAAQLESLYAYCDWALGQAFPQTATGQYLEYHGSLRGLLRKAGSCAAGTVRFSVSEARSQSVAVPEGTVCTTPGLVRFVTTKAAEIGAGLLFVDVPVQAEEPGAVGNAAAGAVCRMPQPPAGVAACSNIQAFSGGADTEGDEALRGRVLDSFIRLPNGANKAFYETRALAHPGVGGVSVLPRPNGPGTVKVVVATTSGAADADLLERVRQDLQSVREISVDVTVAAPAVQNVDVQVTVWPKSNVTFADAKAAVESAIGGHFTGALLGKGVLQAELGSRIFETGRVKNYRFNAPAADVAAVVDTLPRLGTVTVTEGS